MHRRYMMPKPDKHVIDPKWSEAETRTYLKDHEADYVKRMKGGGENLFIHALADEMKADDEQTTYAIRMFYKAYMKQGEGVTE